MSDYSAGRVPQLLTDTSLAYRNDSTGFISRQIAPTITVVKDTAKILTYGTDNLRLVNTLRATGASSLVVDTSVSQATHYTLEDHSVKGYVTEEDYRNAEKPLNPQVDETEMLTDILMVAEEYALALALQATATMTNNTTLTGSDQWNDYTNSDPLDDLKTAYLAVWNNSGKTPNTLVLPMDTYMTLMYHPSVKDLFPGAPMITAEMLQNGIMRIMPGVEKILVGKTKYNSADKGQTIVLSSIWTKTAILAYVETSPKLKSRSLAFTYQESTPNKAEFYPMSTDSTLADAKKDMIRVNSRYDQVLVDVNCGYLVKDAIA